MCCPKLSVDKHSREEMPASLSRFSPIVSIVSLYSTIFVCNNPETQNSKLECSKISIKTSVKKHVKSADADIKMGDLEREGINW